LARIGYNWSKVIVIVFYIATIFLIYIKTDKRPRVLLRKKAALLSLEFIRTLTSKTAV